MKRISKTTKYTLHILLVAAAVILVCAMLCACNPHSGDRDTVVIGTTSVIEKAERDEYAYDVLASGVSEPPLISKTANGEFIPLIAIFKVLNSRSLTYTLIDGLKWSDGTEVTAFDIVYSIEYEFDGEIPAFTSGDKKGKYESYSVSEDCKSVTIVSYESNTAALEEMTTLRIRPRHVYEGKTSVTSEEARISCGPYILESFNKQASTLTFTVNEFFPIKPNFRKIVYKLFGSEEIMYAAMLAGDLDIIWNYSAGVSAAYRDLLNGSDAVRLESVAAANCPAMLVFNNAKGPFADRNLRAAVSYALNYEAFKTYFGSQYCVTPNRSFAPPSLLGFKNTEQLRTDTDKAAEFMQAAGYVKGAQYWEKDSVVAEFVLTVNAGKAAQVGYAEFVKTQLERFGIKVVLDSVNSVTYNVRTSNKYAAESGVSMQAAIMGFTAYGMKNLGLMYIDGNHPVQGGAQVFSDALSDIALQMESAKTPEQYCEAAGRLQDLYSDEIPAVALLWDNLIYACSAGIENVVADGTFGLNNVHNWFSAVKR